MKTYITLFAVLLFSLIGQACSEKTPPEPLARPLKKVVKAQEKRIDHTPDDSQTQLRLKFERELRHADPDVRQGAVLGLVHGPFPESLPALYGALALNHDLTTATGQDTVYSLLEAIEKFGPGSPQAPEAVGALFDYAQRLAWTPEAAYQATEIQHINLPKTLAKFPIALFAGQSTSPVWQVRHLAALGLLRSGQARPDLLQRLQTDPHPEVRCAALSAGGSEPPTGHWPRAYPPCPAEAPRP